MPHRAVRAAYGHQREFGIGAAAGPICGDRVSCDIDRAAGPAADLMSGTDR
jgi:hypothetical protein